MAKKEQRIIRFNEEKMRYINNALKKGWRIEKCFSDELDWNGIDIINKGISLLLSKEDKVTETEQQLYPYIEERIPYINETLLGKEGWRIANVFSQHNANWTIGSWIGLTLFLEKGTQKIETRQQLIVYDGNIENVILTGKLIEEEGWQIVNGYVYDSIGYSKKEKKSLLLLEKEGQTTNKKQQLLKWNKSQDPCLNEIEEGWQIVNMFSYHESYREGYIRIINTKKTILLLEKDNS